MAQPHRILIVEDERIIAEDIQYALDTAGYLVCAVAVTARDALMQIKKLRPDLVLLDINLGGRKSGIRIASEIQGSLGIPIVYLTAFGDPVTLDAVRETEPYGFILKPFDHEELLGVVQTALHRHDIETKLAKSELWFSTTLKSIGDAVITTDTEGRITFMNPTAEKLTGWSDENARNRPLDEVFVIRNEKSKKIVPDPVRRVLREGVVVGLANHTALVTKNGHWIPIEDSGAPILDRHGNLAGVVLVFHDVSKRRTAESKILAMSRYPDENPNPVMRISAEGILIYANAASNPLLESCDCKLNKPVPDFVMEIVRKAIKSRRAQVLERIFNRRFFHLTFAPIAREGYINVYGLDVTRRRESEEALKSSENHFRTLFETMAQGVVFQDSKGRIVSANPAALNILGMSRDEILKQTSTSPEWKAVREDGSPFPGNQHPTMIALRAGRPVRNVLMGIWNVRLQSTRWIYITAIPLRNGGERKPSGVYATFTDITERKQLLESARQSENLYRSLFVHMPDGFARHEIVLDKSGKPVDYVFLEINPAFERLTGLQASKIIGKRVTEVLPGIEKEPFIGLYGSVALGGKPIHFDQFTETIDKAYHIDAYSPIRGQFVTVFTDITDIRRTMMEREKLIRELEQKNAELERFNYTVSHDLKSPLVTIQGFLGLVGRNLDEGKIAEAKKDMARISEASKQMHTLLTELLNLSRIGRIVNPPARVSMTTLAQEAGRLAFGVLKDKRITLRVAEDMPDAWGDPVRIREIWVNLIENAAKFMGNRKNPRITVGFRRRPFPAFYVKDNGQGIDARYLKKVFDLFERLNSESEGSGVGLAIVNRIVELHGGRIWAESKGPGHGATFNFTLDEPKQPES